MKSTTKGGLFRTAAGLCAVALVAGCMPAPETASVAAAPKTPANKTFTSFTPALKCMDDLLQANNKHDIVITTVGIPDSTGKVSTGTKEMLVRALNQMSLKSGAFKVIDYLGKQDDLNLSILFNEAANASRTGHDIPQYYIRGAITQLDDNALESQMGGSIALPFADLGISKDQITSLVSLDMSIGETVSRRIIPETSSSNTMAVVRTGKEGEAGGKIGKAGLNINISLTKSEGMGSSVRALVELGAIETVGQWTKTPYWKCLQIEKSNPKMMETARDWFDSMQPQDQLRFLQRKLAAANYYKGAVSGQMDGATKDALSLFQARNGLIANGQPSFETYYALLDNDSPMADDPTQPVQQTLMTAPRTSQPVAVKVSSELGDAPTYRVNQILSASVQTDRNAFLYCFYQDSDNVIVRLFPNRYQPDPFVQGRSVSLSSPAQKVKVRFDKPGREHISCLASDTEMPLPDALRQRDLSPLSVGSLDQVGTMLRSANPQLTESRMDVSIQ